MPGVKLPEILITDAYQGSQYLLVYNLPHSVMWPAAGWGLQSVTRGEADSVGRPYVGFQFDREGADLFYDLTSANVDQVLAIIIEGKVVSAPNISTAIRGQGVIAGDFTSKQLDDMSEALRKIVRPVSTTVAPVTQRSVGIYLIPVLIFLLAVSIMGFLIYR